MVGSTPAFAMATVASAGAKVIFNCRERLSSAASAAVRDMALTHHEAFLELRDLNRSLRSSMVWSPGLTVETESAPSG